MKAFSFLQDWGTFRNETFVVVGMGRLEILLAMKRQNFRDDAIKAFENEFRPRDNDPADAFIWTYEGVSLLWFRDWKIDLEHYGNLVHETNHLVFEMSRDGGYRDELEANAYQQQYLWLNIIRKMNEFLGVKSNAARGKDESQGRDPRRKAGKMPRLQSGRKGR